MDRRGFLGRLGAAAVAPFAINAVLVDANEFDAPTPAPDGERHITLLEDGDWFCDGRRYRHIHALAPLQKGDIVCLEEGKPVGVATANMRAGEHGYMQVGGMATVGVQV